MSLDRLIGVIDLLDGKCVHAIAGNRASYQPVALTDGDPIRLLNAYADAGVGGIYIADLNALESGTAQVEILSHLIEQAKERSQTIWLDAGWNNAFPPQSIKQLDCDHVNWVAATESMVGPEDVARLGELVDLHRVTLSLDFDGTSLKRSVMNKRTESQTLEIWLELTQKLQLSTVIMLDTKLVGTGNVDAPPEHLRTVIAWLRQNSPSTRLISGGGMPDLSAHSNWVDAGIERVLVATALHRWMRETGDSKKT